MYKNPVLWFQKYEVVYSYSFKILQKLIINNKLYD